MIQRCNFCSLWYWITFLKNNIFLLVIWNFLVTIRTNVFFFLRREIFLSTKTSGKNVKVFRQKTGVFAYQKKICFSFRQGVLGMIHHNIWGCISLLWPTFEACTVMFIFADGIGVVCIECYPCRINFSVSHSVFGIVW